MDANILREEPVNSGIFHLTGEKLEGTTPEAAAARCAELGAENAQRFGFWPYEARTPTPAGTVEAEHAAQVEAAEEAAEGAAAPEPALDASAEAGDEHAAG